MARASRYTLTPLDTYARLLGISPVHFNGAAGATVWPDNGEAQDIWQQYPWQLKTEVLSRDELALAIYNAEMDIRNVLGYAVAPEYYAGEKQTYPKFYRKNANFVTGLNPRGAGKSVITRFGKVLSSGRRVSTALANDHSVTFSDEDGDGWSELATIQLTTDIDPSEIFIYFAGKNGDRSWEIRPVKTKTVSSGTITITADSWLFINPALWEHRPTTTDPSPIDVTTTSNFVTMVDLYRVYIDTTTVSAQFIWEPTGSCHCGQCSSCVNTTQNGCLAIRDAETGIVVPQPASYNSGWSNDSYTIDRDPDQVTLWYQAGHQSEDYLNGFSAEPLDDYLATAVMWLATARLDKPLTGDGLLGNRVVGLQRDMTQNSRDKFFVLNIQTDVFTNPFGTLTGEYKAWQRIARLMPDHNSLGGAI
jgi:hypothetical protein